MLLYCKLETKPAFTNLKWATKTTKTPFWCLCCKLWTGFTHCFGVSIVDFEQLNTDWEESVTYYICDKEGCSLINYYQWNLLYSVTSKNLENTTLYRSSRPEVFCEKGVLRNFAKFTGKHLCHRVSFLKKGLWYRCFPTCKYYKVSKNTYSYRTPSLAASVCNISIVNVNTRLGTKWICTR